MVQQQKRKKTRKAFAVLGSIFQIGMLFAYGFGSNYYNYSTQNDTGYQQFLVQYMLMALFTIVGFGLILSYIKVGTWSGLTLTLLIVSVNIQLSLLLQKFWFNVFTNGFNNDSEIPTHIQNNPLAQLFGRYHATKKLQVNVTTFRIGLMDSISLLVALTGIIGKIKIFQAFITTIIFNIGWNFAYYCNININLTRSQPFVDDLNTNVYLFDDFGTNNVYVFGSIFGIVMMLILNFKPSLTERKDGQVNLMNPRSNMFGLIGTAFVFATFAMTGRTFTNRSEFSDNVGFINIIFALTASVIGTYIMSACLRQGNIGVRQAMLGTISGGVVVGNISGSLNNIASSIAIGLFVGLVTSFWYTYLHPRINKTKIIDSHGVLGTFFISSILGSIIISPTSIAGFYNLLRPLDPINGRDFVSIEAVYLQLGYTGVAAGAALFFGFLAGIISLIFRSQDKDFNDGGLFDKKDFGLRIPNDEEVNEQNKPVVFQSAGHLKV